ncbi:PH domain-containing protein [Staphylococcus pasteuri]|uniref:PH domain-containing protein n=1 Tax=Staphylococcus pasteuri TaxID=45972 RepID=UPI001E5B4F34|nr:PH domain-containing protein [Staphylococcus pasteuri]MCD9067620.1 PH domain-containing protein [Staphylococcus pasteuri]WAE40285.1 PH domain-containing protein [Staphylococcus pasteuri]
MSNYNYMDDKAKKVMIMANLIWLSILFVILIIIVVLNCKFFHISDSWSLVIGEIVLFIICCILALIIIPIFRYKNFRYKIDENEIHVRTGIFFINTNIIPFFRIQNIDVNEGLIMRKYNLATITLSTAGGNSEMSLINIKNAQQIKRLIKERRNNQNNNQYDVK